MPNFKLVLVLIITCGATANGKIRQQNQRLLPHEGYVSSLDEEKNHEYVEIMLPQDPIPILPTKSWAKRIFDDDVLAREFKERYERQFGRTEAEQAQNISNPFVFVDLFNPQGQAYRGTAIEDQTQRQKFAEYMVRRMFEHNVDKFVKNEPAIRPLFEIKERISHADVAVAPGYSMSINYNFSSNNLYLKALNPYAIVEFQLEMNQSKTGGEAVEQHYRVGRQLTKTISMNLYYKQFDGIISCVARQDVTPNRTYTLTLSTYTKPQGRSVREDITLAGMYWQF